MPVRPNSEKQASMLKRSLHWSLGPISQADAAYMIEKSQNQEFEMADAAVLIQNARTLSYPPKPLDEYEYQALTKEMNIVLERYGYTLERLRVQTMP